MLNALGTATTDVSRRSLESGGLGAALLSLLRFGLTRREQLVIRAVLLAPTPQTAWTVARRTRLPYSHVKATVRNLIAWKFLTRTAEGLCFQPEASLWGPPPIPLAANAVETDRPQKAAPEG